mmetsp:Transcript_18116/g.46373  ORF Transcript_18116/g.46373 Transcript_18116/m.46373 type:complete len:221 (-) Transcript_18116:473-1135(-)
MGLVDGLPGDLIPHCLRREHRNHERHHVGEGTRDLEHDDYQGDRHPAHPPEHGGGPDHGVDAWLHHGLSHLQVPRLHEGVQPLPQQPPGGPPDEQGGDEQPGRDLGPEGQGGLDQPDEDGYEEHEENPKSVGGLDMPVLRVRVANPEIFVVLGCCPALLEQSVDRAVRGEAQELGEGVVQDCSDARQHGSLRDVHSAVGHPRNLLGFTERLVARTLPEAV